MRKTILSIATVLISTVAIAGNSRYVNMFMGTAGDHGQVAPAAQMPFGLASVCPDTNPASHAGYDYDVTALLGVSVTRVSGVGGNGAGGNLRIRPAAEPDTINIVKSTEKAVPGYYRASLDNGVSFELTASPTVALERYCFRKADDRLLFIDFNSAVDKRRSSCSYRVIDDRNIEGTFTSSTVCNPGAFTMYFRLSSDKPFTVVDADDDSAQLQFSASVSSAEIRIALSPIDCEAAGKELENLSGKSFKDVRKAAARAWNDILSRVEVSGSTAEQRALFYTSMYRIFLSPMTATSADGRYRSADGSLHTAEDWTFYSCWSMWDTFRAKFPMLCVVAPREMEDFCKSLIDLYQSGKRNWATMTEPVPTVRTEHTQVALLDAWNKGIRGFDFTPAFPAMEQEVVDGLVPGSRQGLTVNSPDQRMETVYDLWAMSEIASIIGDELSCRKYRDASDSLFEATWKGEFMTITDEFTRMRGNGLYQGTRWQYRWAMPIFAGKMIEWTDREQLAEELDEFFARHLFNQGNEPDIQTPFMFNLFGHPEKTDSLVHALLTDEEMIHVYGGNAEYPEPYVGRAFRNTVDGYAPEMDEDDGTMSGWYAFAQMGFYPVCVGTEDYELFTPLFRRVVIHTPDHDVTLIRRCREASASRVTVDGEPLEGFSISHSRLMGAGKVIFE